MRVLVKYSYRNEPVDLAWLDIEKCTQFANFKFIHYIEGGSHYGNSPIVWKDGRTFFFEISI